MTGFAQDLQGYRGYDTIEDVPKVSPGLKTPCRSNPTGPIITPRQPYRASRSFCSFQRVLRSAGLAGGIELFVNQGSSFHLSSGVFTTPPTHRYRSLVMELWNALAHA